MANDSVAKVAESRPDTVVFSTEAFLGDIQGQASDLVNDLVAYSNSPDPTRLEQIIRMARTLKDDLNVLLLP